MPRASRHNEIEVNLLISGSLTYLLGGRRVTIEAGRLAGPRVYFAGPMFDGPEPSWPELSYAISSVPQMQGYVRKLKADGVHVIKGYSGLSDEMLVHLVEASAQESLPVIVDVWGRNGSAGSAATGITAFAHVGWDEISDEAIAVMARENVGGPAAPFDADPVADGGQVGGTLGFVSETARRGRLELALLAAHAQRIALLVDDAGRSQRAVGLL